jgi:hypothetical protein
MVVKEGSGIEKEGRGKSEKHGRGSFTFTFTFVAVAAERALKPVSTITRQTIMELGSYRSFLYSSC